MGFIYQPMLAYTQEGVILRSGFGTIYAEDDTSYTTPLGVTDLSGIPLVTVEIDSLGVVQAFIADVPEAIWKSGPFVLPISSVKGLRIAAEIAALAAEQAGLSAEQAALAAAQSAEQARIAAQNATSAGGSGDGNMVVLPVWNGIGVQPERIFPIGHAQAGQTIPDAPIVYVRWRQPVFPTGVAQEGDEYRRTGS